MSRPLTPDELIRALKKFGIKYNEQPNWQTRKNGSGWGDVQGFMWHHTADDAPDDVDLRIVRDGYSSLSGPLSQFGLRDDGSVDLIAAGAANHAGGGDPAVLTAVIAQTYIGYPPKPRYSHGQVGSTGGNGRFYGVEAYYGGTKPPTLAAQATLPRLAAAVIWGLNEANGTRWNARHAIGHKEWQRGKVDPGHCDCAVLRAQVQAILNSVAATPPVKPPVVAKPPVLVVKPASNPIKPATKPTVPVTGKLDLATRKAWQRAVGTTADGDLGPNSWRAIQRWAGAKPVDGDPGTITWKAVQRKIGSAADGIPGPNTYRALQRYLNRTGGLSA